MTDQWRSNSSANAEDLLSDVSMTSPSSIMRAGSESVMSERSIPMGSGKFALHIFPGQEGTDASL